MTIFGIEYLLRIWATAANESSRFSGSFGRRIGYIFSFTGLIDLVAILPSLLPLLLGEVDLRWLRVLRLVRLLKISHYSTALEDLIAALDVGAVYVDLPVESTWSLDSRVDLVSQVCGSEHDHGLISRETIHLD